MTDDRLARLALSQLGEPGGLRMAGLVADLGRRAALRRAAGSVATRTGMLTDIAARLEDIDPSGISSGPRRRGIRWIVPGDAEWPPALDDLDAVEPLQEMGGVPLGLWVRGPLRLDELPAPVAVVGCRSATTYGTDRRPSSAAGLARAGVGRRLRRGVRHRPGGAPRRPGRRRARPSPCSPAASTVPTRRPTSSSSTTWPTTAPSSRSLRRAARRCGSGSWPATASSPRSAGARSSSRPRSAAARSTPRAGRRGSTGR